MEKSKFIITHSRFFKASYRPTTAKVAPREFSSLTYRLSGEVSIFTTDVSIVSKPGSLTFVPAGCSYETTVHSDGEMLIMHYTPAIGSLDLADHPICVIPKHKDIYINQFLRGIRHYQSEGRELDVMADSYRLLAEAKTELSPALPSPYKKIKELKEYVDENLCNCELRVSALSKIFGTSEVYFRKEFKKYFGYTPIEYIKKQRLELACRLLSVGLYSISEVATAVGFDNVCYFSAEFHRKFGCSPRDYKKL